MEQSHEASHRPLMTQKEDHVLPTGSVRGKPLLYVLHAVQQGTISSTFTGIRDLCDIQSPTQVHTSKTAAAEAHQFITLTKCMQLQQRDDPRPLNTAAEDVASQADYVAALATRARRSAPKPVLSITK